MSDEDEIMQEFSAIFDLMLDVPREKIPKNIYIKGFKSMIEDEIAALVIATEIIIEAHDNGYLDVDDITEDGAMAVYTYKQSFNK